MGSAMSKVKQVTAHERDALCSAAAARWKLRWRTGTWLPGSVPTATQGRGQEHMTLCSTSCEPNAKLVLTLNRRQRRGSARPRQRRPTTQPRSPFVELMLRLCAHSLATGGRGAGACGRGNAVRVCCKGRPQGAHAGPRKGRGPAAQGGVGAAVASRLCECRVRWEPAPARRARRTAAR